MEQALKQIVNTVSNTYNFSVKLVFIMIKDFNMIIYFTDKFYTLI